MGRCCLGCGSCGLMLLPACLLHGLYDLLVEAPYGAHPPEVHRGSRTSCLYDMTCMLRWHCAVQVYTGSPRTAAVLFLAQQRQR